MSRQFTMEVGNYKVVNTRHLTRKKKTIKPTVLSSLFLRLAFSFPAKEKESYFTESISLISFFSRQPEWPSLLHFPAYPLEHVLRSKDKKRSSDRVTMVTNSLPWIPKIQLVCQSCELNGLFSFLVNPSTWLPPFQPGNHSHVRKSVVGFPAGI